MTRWVDPPGETPDVGIPRRFAVRMTIGEQRAWLAAFLRARPVSRRSAMRACVRGAAGRGPVPGSAAGVPGRAPAGAPERVHAGQLAVTGRHLAYGTDPRTQMAIAADLTGPPTGRVLIDLGTDPGYGRTCEAEVRALASLVPQPDGSIRAAEQFFVHGLAERLAPGQAHHYRFRLPDGSTTPDAVFRTAPAAGTRDPFSFTAFADQGVDPGALVTAIAARAPAFHLLAGDICYADPGGRGLPVRGLDTGAGFAEFDPTLWTAYFAAIETSAATTPWMFATGNHDMEALYDDNVAPGGATHGYGGHLARLDLPGTGPAGCPSVYAFTHGNVGVLSLDANDLSSEITTNAGYSGGAQTAWTRDTLAALRADPAIDFVVVFFHHCAYATSLSHASDAGVRDALAPLFDEFTVDLVVQGHNHQYERTDPIRGDVGTGPAPDGATVRPETDGTTYLCVGSGGRPRYSWPDGVTDRHRGRGRGFAGPGSGTRVRSFVTTADGEREPEVVDWSQARHLDHAFVQVDVVPAAAGAESAMTVRAMTGAGVEFDTVTLVRQTGAGAPKPTATGDRGRTLSGLSVPA